MFAEKVYSVIENQESVIRCEGSFHCPNKSIAAETHEIKRKKGAMSVTSHA
jgi:hypothetical protein